MMRGEEEIESVSLKYENASFAKLVNYYFSTTYVHSYRRSSESRIVSHHIIIMSRNHSRTKKSFHIFLFDIHCVILHRGGGRDMV